MLSEQYLKTHGIGSGGISKTKEREYLKRISNLTAIADIHNRVSNVSDVFYDIFEGDNDYSIGQIDETKTTVTSAVISGTNTLIVTSSTNFAIGQEITLQDNSNKEYLIISNISGNTLTFTSNIVNNYSQYALVYRSLGQIDTINKYLKFSNGVTESTSVTYDYSTPTTVVGLAYETGNGGKKLTRLSNGWFVASAYTGSFRHNFYISKDNGATWQDLCYLFQSNTTLGRLSITSYNNNIYVLNSQNVSGNYRVVCYIINSLTQTNSNIYGVNQYLVDNNQLDVTGSVDIASDSAGVIYACWASRNGTYPNSYNIRYSKSVNGTSWDAVTQINTSNSAGVDRINPFITIANNGYPVIVLQLLVAGSNQIDAHYYNGTSWQGGGNLYLGGNYAQYNPRIIKSSDGNLHATWEGKDATYPTYWNIYYSKSTDNGVTWSAKTYITTSNTTDSINAYLISDNNNNIFVLYNKPSNGIYQRKYNSTIWEAETQLVVTGSNPIPISNFTSFTQPIFVYQNGSVKFKGVWVEGSTINIPLLAEDIRYNISNASNINEIVTWIKYIKLAGFTVNAKFSIVANGSNENYQNGVNEIDTSDITYDELQNILVATPNSKVTLKINMTRSNTSQNAYIKQVLGAVM